MKSILQTSGLAAIVGALTVIAITVIDARFADIPGIYDTGKLMESLPLVFMVAALVGMLTTSILLFVLGFPIACLLEKRLETGFGLIASIGTAALGCGAFYAFITSRAPSTIIDAVYLGILASYALPASILYRRSALRRLGGASNN